MFGRSLSAAEWFFMLTTDLVCERALALGFDLIGFAPAGETPHAQRFTDWLAAGHAGEMAYLARPDAVDKRFDPHRILPGARTVILVGVSYETLAVPMDVLQDPSRGRIARYAWGADYHDIITPVLREFGEWIANESRAYRAYVDTGPVLERAWAEQCGLGFIGKNTCLIQRKGGSYLFLGAVLVAEELKSVIARNSQSRWVWCMHALPGCLPNECVSRAGCAGCAQVHLVSHHRVEGQHPNRPAPAHGQLDFWMRYLPGCMPICAALLRPTRSALGQSFYPVNVERAAPRLVDVLSMSRTNFGTRFKGTALQRTKWRGLLRNACVAAGNWGNDAALPALKRLLTHDELIVREHAQWAIEKITTS